MAGTPFVRYLLQPLRGAPAVLIVVCSVLAALASAAGIFGIALSALLASWIWSYTFILVDHTAHGMPPPTLSYELANPWHEARPLASLLVLALLASLAWWLAAHGMPGGVVAIVAFAIVSFPASLAVLAVEGDFLRAISPLALFGVARGLGWLYALLILASLVAAALLVAVRGHVPGILWYALLQFALFEVASLLGGALYERRLALGIEAYQSPERASTGASERDERERDRAVDEIYGLVRARQLTAALARLDAALGPPPVDPERCRWLRDRAAQWEDGRIADRLTAELITRLLAMGRRGEAVLVLEDWWRRGRGLPSYATRDLDLLERAASELGHAATKERLGAERAAAAARTAQGSAPRAE